MDGISLKVKAASLSSPLLEPDSFQLTNNIMATDSFEYLQLESSLRAFTEPAVFVRDVAEQHDIFSSCRAHVKRSFVSDWTVGVGNSRVLLRRFV